MRIVLVAPERLRSRAFREALSRVSLSLLVVDEAHCLSQWGHDFRPDYLHIADARAEFKPSVTLAMTATATPRVQDDIVTMLGIPQAERIITGFNRPNLTFEVLAAPDERAKLALTQAFLKQAEGAGIIYAGTRRDTEEIAAFAQETMGLRARYYHGALDAATRTEAQDAFMSGDVPLVVATNAFGMGIDRPDVRFVLHYAMPGSLEAYYQEAGRAGRDGLPARAVLLYSPKDSALHEFFIENDSPDASELRTVHNFLKRTAAPGDGPDLGVSPDAIEQATGIGKTKVRVALELLEAAKALRRMPSEAFGQMPVEVLPLPETTLQAISKQVAQRREHKRALLDIMITYAETDACRRRTILQYFGDHSPADAPICCDNCLARDPLSVTGSAFTDQHAHPLTGAYAPAPERPAESQPERAALIVLDTVARLKRGLGKGKLAGLLKGSQAQEIQPYTRERNFAKFAALPTREIESLVEQLLMAGYLKQTGGGRPTLRLSPRGEAALKARAAITVDLRVVQPAAAQRSKAKQQAGGTVALTGQMLARGLTPDQIAAERALTVYTIYSHLAQLIADQQVELDAVVPRDTQEQIRAAIEKAGSAAYLSPIKALLPEEISYEVIRCVVEAWKREQGAADQPHDTEIHPALPAAYRDLALAPLRQWRERKAAALGQPYYYLFGDHALHQLARARPQSKAELRTVSGLSVEVIEQYADELISIVKGASSSEVTNAILACLRSLPGQLPRSGAAKLLVGSGSQRVETYRNHPLYNRLAGHSRIDVTVQVDALLEQGLIDQDDKGHLIPKAER
ncbi:MAG: RecQ family ATP-dependent DNA helicase [Chloroflexi bacterium]|nr:RecQ family ATP-dependent DNA helicase [Chloroflexota bacterium]